MNKVRLLNFIFLIIEIMAFIPLTIEVFGDMNPNVLTISAIIFGIGMIGNCICVIVKDIRELRKK